MKTIRTFLKNAKGSFGDLKNAALGLGVFGMVVVLIAILMTETQTVVIDVSEDNASNPTGLAYNLTVTILGAIEDLSDWTPIIVVAIIMVVILSLILRRLGYI